MQTQLIMIALGATLFSAQVGSAEENNQDSFYADIGYSRVGYDLPDTIAFEATPEFDGVSGHVGYRFSKYWSVEGEAIVGVDSEKRERSGISYDGYVVSNTKKDLNQLVSAWRVLRSTIPTRP